jgi:3'-phosphoadenosine 5'-phosphosulfate sulfotransferase (PAPS reductase)/FAD synthetase
MLEHAEIAIEKVVDLLKSGITLSVGVSFGKDSTSVLCVVIEAVLRLKQQGIEHSKVYVTSSNTKRENAAMDYYTQGMSLELNQFILLNDLNMEFKEVVPTLSGTFIWTVIGRGKFPRYHGLSRDCAVDEKIRPQQKFVNTLKGNGDVVSLVGSRKSESRYRAVSMAKHQMDELTVACKDGQMTFAVIADWDLLDVWEWLTCVDRGSDLYQCKFFSSLDLMSQLYKDANDGVCGVVTEQSSQACGSRFGCNICVASGATDKSLKSMLEEAPERYGFMKGYVAIQEWLFNIRFDLSKREFRGRRMKSVADREYISVAADYFNAETKLELLRYLLTLDAVELERAHKHSQAFYAGEIEDTEWNRALCYPMFEMITKDSILAIDFAWSIGRDFRYASAAAKAYIEVHHLKARYYPPVLDVAAKETIPEKRWIDVTGLSAEVGLSDPYVLNGRLNNIEPKHSNELAISAGAGFSYIEAIMERFNHLDKVDISEVARAAIVHGWITMPAKEFKRYHQIALRNEMLFRAYNKEIRFVYDDVYGDDVIQTLPSFLNELSISDAEFRQLEANQLKIDVTLISSDDIFGADSIFEAMQEESEKRALVRKHSKRTPVIDTIALGSLTAASRQLTIQM